MPGVLWTLHEHSRQAHAELWACNLHVSQPYFQGVLDFIELS